MTADRTTYYKAANLSLEAPYRRGHGQLYLPGTEHTPDWFDPDAAKSCTHGLYYCSHPRVAARWGPVVLQVQILGYKLKTNDKVKPGAQPDAVKAQKYQKYRTDRMRIIRIVGVTGYAGHLDFFQARELGMTEAGSRRDALDNLAQLNQALVRAGKQSVIFLNKTLERLRADSFRLWAVEDPNAVPMDKARVRPERHEMTYELTLAADHPMDEVELIKHIYDLDGVYAGSVRARRVGWSRL